MYCSRLIPGWRAAGTSEIIDMIAQAWGRMCSLLAGMLCVAAVSAQSPEIDFSHHRGLYDTAFLLELNTNLVGATIRFTIDGRNPSPTAGQTYAGPILVDETTVIRAYAYKATGEETPIKTHSYIFIDDVLQQPYSIPGWPNSARLVNAYGETEIEDYAMDPAIVTDPAYAFELPAGMRKIPTMSLATGRFDFLLMYEGDDVEKPISVEVIYPDGSHEQVDGGIQAHSHNRLKRSLRLYFRASYGPDKFDTKLFRQAPWAGDDVPGSVDRIVLRGGNNRCWARDWTSTDFTTYGRDEFYRQSQAAMSGDAADGTFVHLYVNGIYWGLYNPVQRPDHWFSSDNIGGDEDEWFANNHSGDFSGNDFRYNYLHNTVKFADLSDAFWWDELHKHLDVDRFFDYMIATWMIGMEDWPTNNWWGGNRNSPPGPYRYFAWDGEQSFGHDEWGSNAGAWVDPDFVSSSTGTLQIAGIWNEGKHFSDFLMAFADRVYEQCFNDGPMTDSLSLLRWTTINDYIKDPVIAESARWGDAVDGPTRTRDNHWLTEVAWVASLINGNVNRFLTALRAEGYYPTFDPPEFNRHGGKVPPNFQIHMQNPNTWGTIFYRTDGGDPRQPGGGVAPEAQVFTGSFQVLNSKTVIARVKQGSNWSAAHEAFFFVRTPNDDLKLTEIMYHPDDFAGTPGSQLEFLEFKNTGSDPIELSGMTFDQGIDYTFPTDAVLGPGEFWVICNNWNGFAARYPGVTPNGEYTNKLSNSGERLKLIDGLLNGVINVNYSDATPWTALADGLGYSLVPREINPIGSQDNALDWRPSTNLGGSPGADDPPPVGTGWLDVGPIINEIVSHSELPITDLIEIHNPTDSAIDISHWYLTDDRRNPYKFQIPAGTVLPADGYITYTEADFSAGATGFKLSRMGEDAYLFAANPAGVLTGYEHGWEYGPSFQNVSLGAYTNSVGDIHLVAMDTLTDGPNSTPYIDAIVVEKLNYHDVTGDYDFITLLNKSNVSLPLYDPAFPLHRWRIPAIGFTFPPGAVFPADSRIIITEADTNDFRANFGIPTSTRVYQYDGALSNGGERVFLEVPDEPDTAGCVLEVPYVAIDGLHYRDDRDWPIASDGLGTFLQRRAPGQYSNDPINWDDACLGANPALDPLPCNYPVLITEVNYHSSPTADAGDWVELHNTSGGWLDLAGYELRDQKDEHSFLIPGGLGMLDDERIVLAGDTAKFAAQHGDVTDFTGPIGFGFDASGKEAIRLFDPLGNLVVVMAYHDDPPFPEEADGGGWTLELKNPDNSLSKGQNWFAGCPGGSPAKAWDPVCEGCEAPLNPVSSGVGVTNATLTWDAVTDAVGYQVAGKPIIAPNFNQGQTAETNFTVGVLSPATTYEWQVRAYCGFNFSPFSVRDTFTTGIPRIGAPWTLAPNPVTDILRLNGYPTEAGAGVIRIADLLGTIVLEQDAAWEAGPFIAVMDVSELPGGIYLIEWPAGTPDEPSTEVRRFVKSGQ